MGKKKDQVTYEPVEPKPGLGGTTFGGFSDPGYISIGDTYGVSSEVPSRHGGDSIKTNPAKTGKGRDAYFDQDVRLVHDSYTDPGKSTKEKDHREAERKRILAGPWKLPNPTKKATGAGSFIGTFYEKAPPDHKQDYDVIKRGELPQKPPEQKVNIAVGSQKTGGFGMVGAGIYFSNPEPPKEKDEYNAQRDKERAEAAAHKKKDISIAGGGKPFRSTAKPKITFDEAEQTGISKVYGTDKPRDAKALPPIKGKEKDKMLAGPFKYTNATKRGEEGNLNRWTKRGDQADHYDSLTMAMKEEKKNKPKFIGGVWKNNGAPKAGCTRSLLKRFY